MCEGEVAQASGGKGTDGSSWWDSGGDGESDDDDRERCEFCKLGSLTASATTTVSATSAKSTTSFLRPSPRPAAIRSKRQMSFKFETINEAQSYL